MDKTSLAVLVGALAVWAGYPIADPIVGLLITLPILLVVAYMVMRVVLLLWRGV